MAASFVGRSNWYLASASDFTQPHSIKSSRFTPGNRAYKATGHFFISINVHNIRLKIPSLLCRNVETPSYVVTFRLRVARGTFSEYRGNLFSIKFL